MQQERELARGWAWRWTAWPSWPVTPFALVVAAAAVVSDMVSSWFSLPAWHVGQVLVSPGLLLGGLLVFVVGAGNVGFSRASLRAWREFLILGAPVVAIWALAFPRTIVAFPDMEGIVLALATEELVYRFAAVLLFGACFARLAGNDWRNLARWGEGPALGAIVASAVLFGVLPGHVDQLTGAANVASFLSVALLLGYASVRTGSLLPSFLVHLAIDLVALEFFAGELPGTMRVVIDAGALVGLVLGALLAGRRLGLRRRVPRVIDLRDLGADDPVVDALGEAAIG
ncbi:MAG: CPBP family intramembrane glutamic endopeptidase [Acidimicrobiia bacterium]